MTGPAGATGALECFVRGTRIATPTGQVPVEDLAVGDDILTADGATRPIRWIGRRRLRVETHMQPERVRPVRIALGAFAPHMPSRDLYLSPGHGLFVENSLIPAACLINGRTVTWGDHVEVEYIHIELAQHDILLAENLPAESYLDTGNRADFGNHDGPVNLHPMFASLAHEAARAPFVIAGPVLDRARAKLELRADILAPKTSGLISPPQHRGAR